MIQHITIEQFNELSENAQIRLYKWCMKKYHYTITQDLSSTLSVPKLLLTIGHMIQFLYTESPIHSQRDGILFYRDVNKEFHMSIGRPDKKGHKELCDALWEAVKEILELKGCDYGSEWCDKHRDYTGNCSKHEIH